MGGGSGWGLWGGGSGEGWGITEEITCHSHGTQTVVSEDAAKP